MIGKKIRHLRKEKGLTQKELAKLTGISQSYISELEAGIKTNPSIEIAKRIAEVLEIDICQLVYERK
ncbi:helix-turn-helix domain-containing protein [Caldicellulosiruptor acetigenus]|uniref:helix-turn-helix domain-containing protein n=1 Tax=Caldicellulosiruptor acetigenus TaxID=301953 RepID=UPI0022A8F7BB|nr:helix-turn-helix transcriptional regulator [Caldicellulosiruptor acetigenus]WAM36575.1 helix-turn-helix domain-containing protein [Caldicellulosiruptor acetigenus]